jgi:UDPglucose 6-dehydrogenase
VDRATIDQLHSGSADLQYMLVAARNIGRHTTGFKAVAGKSNVPVGTAGKASPTLRKELAQRRQPDLGFSVISNPEFLTEGVAMEDFTRPDRMVLGVADDAAGQQAAATTRQLCAPFNGNHERTRAMDVKSA